jgi:hypothetical protein
MQYPQATVAEFDGFDPEFFEAIEDLKYELAQTKEENARLKGGASEA